MTASVVLNDLYGKHSKDLDGSIAQKILSFITKLQTDPTSPGLDLKTPEGVSDKRIKTARVNDFWRAVLLELNPFTAYTLVAVKPHDDAYVFAASLGYNVNQASGALEIVDTAALATAIADTKPAAEKVAPIATATLFPSLGLKPHDLAQFGIAADVIGAVFAVPDVDALLEFVDALPKNLQNILLDLGEGRPVDDVWADHVPTLATPVDPQDLLTAATTAASRIMFTDGSPEELRAVLEGSFRAWRVWLHPLQRSLAYHDGWNGPARVTGGAGTGKTVTVLHRARHLAKRLAEAPGNEKVLVTMYNRNLAPELMAQLIELAGAGVKDRVEVVNIDRLVYRVLHELDPSSSTDSLQLVDENHSTVDSAVELALSKSPGDWDPGFVRAEWNAVILSQGITTKEQYLKAPRAGRSVRLSKPQRAQIWDTVERLTHYLRQDGVTTYTQAAARAAALLQTATTSPKTVFRHAVIDEGQDFHPAHWRFIRALVPPGQDDLFIAGDAHQRLYGAPVRLSSCGINIVGRSRRLTVNYRTSRQILQWCVAIERGEPVDDLDDGTETLAGARSEFSGPAPLTWGANNQNAELHRIIEILTEWHGDQIDWHDMAVMTRYTNGSGKIADDLHSAGIPAIVLAKTGVESSEDAVRVMTMHRSKGLEFRAVAMTGISAHSVPPNAIQELDGEQRKAAYISERNLLYVAASRARERLSVSWVGEPSVLLANR